MTGFKDRFITRNELLFLLFCIIVNLFIDGIGLFQLFAAPLIVFSLRNFYSSDRLEIPRKREFVSAFILVFLLYAGIHGYYYYKNIFGGGRSYSFRSLLFQLPSVVILFAALFTGVRIRDFHWKTGFSSLLVVLLVWLLLGMLPDLNYIRSGGIGEYLLRIIVNFPIHVYYPAVVEEVIFRGLLLSCLLALGFSAENGNILQAVFFGLIHLINYRVFGFSVLLHVVPQMFTGFLIGKIYLHTKSLTPCIILHALIDS